MKLGLLWSLKDLPESHYLAATPVVIGAAFPTLQTPSLTKFVFDQFYSLSV
jgi:hypothetical protein